MTWAAHQLPALIVSAFTIWAFWLIGNKRRLGWLIGLISEVLWVGLAIWLTQWGLLISCVFFLFVYWRNWVKWGK